MKGPKGMLASAIADALDEYFVVDARMIESNLLKNTKIQLDQVQLRPQPASILIGLNTHGTSTNYNVSGQVESIIFSWTWNATGSGKSWIKDAKLTIRGVTIQIDLTEEEETAAAVAEEITTVVPSSMESFVANNVHIVDRTESADLETRQEIERTPGGFSAYIQNQVKMVIDALTLELVDFHMTISMMSSSTSSSTRTISMDSIVNESERIRSESTSNIDSDPTTATSDREDNTSDQRPKNDEPYKISIVAGAQKLLIVSKGRQYKPKQELDNDSGDDELSETAILESIYLNIIEESWDPSSATAVVSNPNSDSQQQHSPQRRGKRDRWSQYSSNDDVTTNGDDDGNRQKQKHWRNVYPLQDPFSYRIDVVRSNSDRFSSILSGLTLKGTSLSSSLVENGSGDRMQTQTDRHGGIEGKLSFYLSRPQIEAFGRLSGLLLAPPSSSESTTTPSTSVSSSITTTQQPGGLEVSYDGTQTKLHEPTSDVSTASSSSNDKPSTLELNLGGASLNFMDDTSTIQLDQLSLYYVADGSQLRGKIGLFQYRDNLILEATTKQHPLNGTSSYSDNNGRGARGTEVIISDIDIGSRPSIEMTLGCVSTMYIPETVELKQDMHNVRIAQVGETWTCKVNEFHISFPEVDETYIDKITTHDEEEKDHHEKDSVHHHRHHHHQQQQLQAGQLSLDSGDGNNVVANHQGTADHYQPQQKQTEVTKKSDSDPAPPTTMVWVSPFPAVFTFENASFMKGEAEQTRVEFQQSSIWMSPKDDKSGTEVAVSVGVLQSDLANGTDLNAFALIPAVMGTNTFHNVAFAARVISVTAGYTVQDWLKTFSNSGLWSPSVREESSEPVYYQLPFADIAKLKVQVQYNALSLLSVKQTTIHIAPFKGNQSTTSKDIATYYTNKILAKSHNFLQNAEVLGLNVEDAGSFALGAALAAANPFAGVAAMVGVDAVRSSVEAGKRARKVNKDDRTHITDVVRGLGYLAVEATEKGAVRRGKLRNQRMDAFDWLVGASETTGQYIDDNKEKLGQAGGATAGMITGGVIAGPAGMVVGGLIGGISSAAIIRRLGVNSNNDDDGNDAKDKKWSLPQRDRPHLISNGTLSLENE